MRTWTHKEIEFLKENYLSMTADELAHAMSKTNASIAGMRTILGLRKNKRHKEIFPGFRSGDLTVIKKISKSSDSHSVYLCICLCKNIVETRSDHLSSGKVVSCGCSRRKFPDGVVSINTQYHMYKRNAKRRKVSFELTKEDFITFIFNPCYYCGSGFRDYNHFVNKKGEIIGDGVTPQNIKRAWVRINGIDRVDSSKGYVMDNCVTCCSKCNMAKGPSTYSEFLLWIAEVHSFLTSSGQFATLDTTNNKIKGK